MQQKWQQFKRENHSYSEYQNFVEEHTAELEVLPIVYADILYNQAKTLLQEQDNPEGYEIGLNLLRSYLKEFIKYSNIKSPIYAFSFRACTEYAFEDLRNCTCSLVHPSYFNDPIDPLLINWLKLKIEKQNANKLYPLLFKATHNIRMRCLARAKDDDVKNLNPLMWAHYADSHKGFCVKYCIDSEKFNNTDMSSLSLHEVKYTTLKSINQIKLSDALFAKQPIWKYERELRLVSYDLNLTDMHDITFLKGVQVDSLFVGCKCSEEHIMRLMDIFRNSIVPIYKMVVDVKNPMKYSYIRIV